MKTFEDWLLYVIGGVVAVGTAAGRGLYNRIEGTDRRVDEHAAVIAQLVEAKANTKNALDRIESKVDKIIEREIGA